MVSFEPSKVAVAMMKAFLAVHGTQGAASASVRETVDALTEAVVRALMRSRPSGGSFHIEDIQDQVELGLMRGGHHDVARAYVLYRERRAQERAQQGQAARAAEPAFYVTDRGQRVPVIRRGDRDDVDVLAKAQRLKGEELARAHLVEDHRERIGFLARGGGRRPDAQRGARGARGQQGGQRRPGGAQGCGRR